MRISDWSSDVCSSDLALFGGTVIRIHHRRGPRDTVLADFDDSRFIQLSSNNLKNISFGKLGAAHGRLRQIIPQIARHGDGFVAYFFFVLLIIAPRSEEHTSELQSLMRISSAVFCLKKKTITKIIYNTYN